MTVKGIYRQPIEIEVGKEELFRGLVCELDLTLYFTRTPICIRKSKTRSIPMEMQRRIL